MIFRKIVKGYVSTEIDAKSSFDTNASIEKARKIIEMYKEIGIEKDRILIKIAATWEGIKAAEVLEKEGIKCNLTLIFSLTQAIACAEAGVYLISPFVGRVNDYWSKKLNKEYKADEEPGVYLVKEIYNYYKYHKYSTILMAASLRTYQSVLEISGCDRITIPPNIIEKLATVNDEVIKKLDEKNLKESKKINIDEKLFRWMLNEDEMATDKLAEGIRVFAKDTIKLEELIKAKLSNK